MTGIHVSGPQHVRIGEKSASYEEADWTSTWLTDGSVYVMRTLSHHRGRDEGGVCVGQAPWFEVLGTFLLVEGETEGHGL